MKKRIFIPVSLGFALLNIFFWGLTLLIIVIFILDQLGIDPTNIEWGILEYFLISFGILFLLYTSVRFLFCFKIHLRKNDIATFGDGLPKFEKIQYKCIVNYKDIQSIAIVASDKNSKNQSIQLAWVSSSMPKKYLEFTLQNVKKKQRICINYYNKKQVIKMLKYINENMQEVGNENKLNIDEIMQDWYIYGGYNREDLKLKRGEKIRKKSKKQNAEEIASNQDSANINSTENNETIQDESEKKQL